MGKHLQREIEVLKTRILALGASVESRVREATVAMESRDGQLAMKVIDEDIEIDQVEVEVEEECLKILALHQPVATDLRFIIAVLKINNDLERIGDLSVNVAEQAYFLSNEEPLSLDFDFIEMAGKTQEMLKKSLDALVNLSVDMAYEVRICDDEVDALNRQAYALVEAAIRRDPARVEAYVRCLSVARQLERIADHATNIAEDVIYMINGEIVRHQTEDFGGDR